ncbi:hypothetical protein CC78DRAFT_267912 [Lojkania enalia]|uniref:Uncharacterized protein n=1 Tax=Lojkania enalia TaxID=147567 RepID=A0A9P4K8G7_9PLEO|nr:hypothetical protein CC78DRAFT_267912 [Didymosphaeria enalia]
MSWTTFHGPWSKDLEAFKQSITNMPSQYKEPFDAIARESSTTICDMAALHVWESDSDIDALLHLTHVIVKIRSISTYIPQETGKGKLIPLGMVIIAELKQGRDNFRRLCEQVKHLTNSEGTRHLHGTVYAFGSIAVVKGVNNALTPDVNGRYNAATRSEMDAAVKRINVTIDRIFKESASGIGPGNNKLIWHHGPVIHFLLHWINNTTSTLRSYIGSITVTSALDFTQGFQPSILGTQNKMKDLERLETYCKRLAISAVFLDPKSQFVVHDCIATYIYYFSWYIHTLVPQSLLREHFHTAQDALVTFAFRLRGASERKYTDDVVRMVKKHLDKYTAKPWAKFCISPSNYTKQHCRNAATDLQIHNAVQLAADPFAFLAGDERIAGGASTMFPALARLFVGPCAGALANEYVSAPFGIDAQTFLIRASSDSPFRVYIPAPEQTVDLVTERVRGTFMAVIQCLRMQLGDPILRTEERMMWQEVKKACGWAIDGCEFGLPGGVIEKVRFVEGKFVGGMWEWLVSGTPVDGWE